MTSSRRLTRLTVERVPLRERIYQVLLERVVNGHYAPGIRLSDSAVAEELDVSRTPVREALLRLEGEGFLANDHLRGFSVPALDTDEARELYPLLWTLERLALESSPGRPPAEIAHLRRLNERFGNAGTPLERLARDREFHEALCAPAGNRRLAEHLHRLRQALLRYELVFMSDGAARAESEDEHEAIVTALEERRIADAQRLLRAHWRRGMDSLLARLEA